MATELRIGVVGLGRAGASMLSAMLRHPDIKVTAAADPIAAHRARFEAEVGGATYLTADELCQKAPVDVVYVATPHGYHADHAVMAAQHGKHVIVEKPMAISLEDCDRIIDAVDKAGVKLVVGHTASFNPSVLKMRELIIRGEVGRLAMISATAYTDFLYRPRRPEELVTELGGGIIYNQVPHQVDAARFLAGGMARSVRATTWILDPARPTEGSYMALLDFESGAAASLVYSGYDHFDSGDIATGRGHKPAERYGAIRRALGNVHSPEEEVAMRISTGYGGEQAVTRQRGEGGSLLQGELGSFLVSCADADLRLTPDGVAVYGNDGLRTVAPNPWRGVPGRGNTLDELYYAVTAGRPVVHHGRWAKATMEVCIAMLQSARVRREITLKHQVPTVDVEG